MSRELLMPDEVRQQWTVSRWTLVRLVRDGKLTPISSAAASDSISQKSES
jgi:hypothetical protein